jgi:hypothetical protein
VHRGVPAPADQQQVATDALGLPGTPSRSGATSAAVTRSTPAVPVTTCPARTAMPRLAHADAHSVGGAGRASTTGPHLDAGVGEVDRRA